MLPNKVYDVLKWISLIALDALGLCYQKLAQIWAWPYGDEIQQTCVAVSICIGVLIGVSTAQYNKQEPPDNL